MKILHLTTHINAGGITSYLEKLIKPLRALGVECEIVSSGGEMSSHFESLGVPCHKLDIRTKSELSLKLLRAAPRLVDLLQSGKFDVIHAHTRITQVLAHRVSKKFKIPVVTTCHGFFKKRLGRRLLPAWGDCVVAISDPVHKALLEQYPKNELNVETILNAVDCDALSQELKLLNKADLKTKFFSFSEDDVVIGNVGRLVPMKGHSALLKAFKIIRKDVLKAKLLIVGGGKMREELEQLAESLQVADSVVFTGALENPAKGLAVMDVFVFPVIAGEGFGLSPLEAMVAGVPVVTGRSWPVTAYFSDPAEALVSESLAPEEIASDVLKLLSNNDLASSLSHRGFEFARKRFDIHLMAGEMKDLYERIRLTRGRSSL